MILHREYLIYDPYLFLVSFEGEEGKRMGDSQALRIKIESATRGNRRAVERLQATGTVATVKRFAQESLDREYEKRGEWKRFAFRRTPTGYSGSSLLAVGMSELIKECGAELAHERLKNGDEPEIVARCGGELRNALTVLESFSKPKE